MPESFLILFAGGIMLAVAISTPRDVTLQWLRLGGILALVMAALSVFFLARREEPRSAGQWLCCAGVIVAILGQLAMAQLAGRAAQRLFALAGLACAVTAGVLFFPPARGVAAPLRQRLLIEIFSSLGIAAMTGLALMDMLLGHAYLTAAKMSMRPFRRLNLALGTALLLRAGGAVGGVLLLQRFHPIYKLWAREGLFIGTRWLVGLLVPAAFIFMAHDCIRRRATQSATGILYVAGVLIFIGELIALNLVRETGLPF